jgi:phenylacetate-coenzyme A ligase PaaK-like adenylate-forming protein
MARARQLAERAAATPLAAILDVLEATGAAWADPAGDARRTAMDRLAGTLSFSPPMTAATLDMLPGLLARESLLGRIRSELGPEALLDGWVHDARLAASTALVPRGTLLHVSAGNVFLGCVDSLVMGLVTKNVNVLKLSRADPFFPLLFVETLAAHDPDRRVADLVAVVPWKGGDAAVESVFKEEADTIVVWGGEESVKSWRDGLALSTRLVEYGPKLSGAVVTRRGMAGADMARLGAGIARDVAMWDQAACSSPQTLYVEDLDGGEPGSGAEALVPHVVAGLAAIEDRLPLGRLTMDEKVEVRKAREMARFAMAQGEGRLWESPGSMRWTVVLDRRPGFVLSPGNRTLVVKPFRDVGKVSAEVSRVRAILQALAVLAAPDELPALSLALAGRGANRLCLPGRMSEVVAGGPHDGRYPLAELVRRVVLEVDAPAVSAPARLAAVLAHAARRSPFWARRAKGIDPGAPDAIAALPLLTGEDVYRHTPPVGGDLLTGPVSGAVAFASGGSTGQPKYSYYTHAEFDRVTAVLAQLLAAAGLERGDRVANLFIAGQLWSSFVAVHGALAKLECLSLPIGGHSELAAVCETMRTFRANVVIGLPSMVVELAHFVKSRRIRGLAVSKVFYGGEHVSDAMREFLARSLGVSIVRSAGYASVDAGTIGYQCRQATGSIHHLVEGHQHLELLDPETGQTVADGEPGEVVVTSLERFLMPMIRYRTGDLARAVSGACACGRADRRFELLGRCDDRLQIGGARVVLADVARALAGVAGLTPLFQLEASARGSRERLLVRVERAAAKGRRPLTAAARAAVLEACEDLRLSVAKGWLAELAVEVVAPGGLPRIARTRKVRAVVDLRRESRR